MLEKKTFNCLKKYANYVQGSGERRKLGHFLGQMPHATVVREYLRHVEKQTHPYYKTIDPACFRFEFDLSLLLATSHSVNNPERLYLKCPAHTFKFFQWINQTPKGMAKDILTERS